MSFLREKDLEDEKVDTKDIVGMLDFKQSLIGFRRCEVGGKVPMKNTLAREA